MRVLVACEFSGVVRRAFSDLGHEAYSCDLLASDDGSDYHFKCDVARVIHDGWDLMIAHPPCTHIPASGARWWPQKIGVQREALEFMRDLLEADVPRIAIENPVGLFSTWWCKPDQIIQPWQFGEPEWKTTCLWLKGLPLLQPTAVVEPDKTVGGGKRPGRVSSRIHRMGPSKNRQRERSRTYPGIAAAMAAQWGNA